MTDSGITHITDDIVQVRIPLPYALNIVNCYLLRGESGWTLVDTGLNTPPARAQWRAALRELAIVPQDIEKIVVTHMHPDHFGMAGWWQGLLERPLPVFIPELERQTASYFFQPQSRPRYQEWLLACGMDRETINQVEGALGNTRDATQPHPVSLSYLAADSEVALGRRRFRALHAPGHSDGQLIFFDEDDQVCLSGDHVLMKITPNIGAWMHTEPNPLRRYLDSLRALAELPVRIALPGHKWLIHDWRGRIEELIAHHDLRLQHTLEALDGGASSVYEVARQLFDMARFTPHEWRFAMAEALAHLQLLEADGRIARGDGALFRFQIV